AVCAQHVEVANADRDRAGARALRALRRAYPLAALERSRGCCCVRDGWGEGKAEEVAALLPRCRARGQRLARGAERQAGCAAFWFVAAQAKWLQQRQIRPP